MPYRLFIRRRGSHVWVHLMDPVDVREAQLVSVRLLANYEVRYRPQTPEELTTLAAAAAQPEHAEVSYA